MNYRSLLAALFFATTWAHADTTRPNTVFVVGEARAEVAPDYAVVNVLAGTQGTDRSQLFARLQRTVDEVLTLALAAGVKNDEIDASELERREEIDDRRIRTTVLERRIRIVVRNLTATQPLVDKLLLIANITTLNTKFLASSEEKLKEKLLLAAAENARGRGTELAVALGRKIGAASTISQEPFEEIEAHMSGLGRLMLGENAAPAYAPPAKRGSAEYRVPAKLHFTKRVFVIFDLQ